MYKFTTFNNKHQGNHCRTKDCCEQCLSYYMQHLDSIFCLLLILSVVLGLWHLSQETDECFSSLVTGSTHCWMP